MRALGFFYEARMFVNSLLNKICVAGILLAVLCAALLCPMAARADVFGTVRGVVHDPQHRPIGGATIQLSAVHLDWQRTAQTDANGEFLIDAVPAGEYVLEVTHENFRTVRQPIVVNVGAAPILHFAMELASVEASVSVSAAPEATAPTAASLPTDVTREDIARTPGASYSDSLAMITDYVPSAYMVHDQLHVRGGHQVTWLVDGVPIPNTNIASNVGIQFHPGDIETLEVQRGGYSADYGDRTYGVFNVITRNGFERNREAELTLNAGSFYRTDDQLSFGDHTDRFAYFVSGNGYRTDLGLATPVAQVLHDSANGYGGFGSFIYNATPSDQLRLVTSLRNDYFQVPNDADMQAAGIADVQHERDGFANFSWVHTVDSGTLLTVSPFYHYNRAAFDGGPNEPPLADHRASQYAGMQATLAVVRGKHNVHVGLYGFAQHDNDLYRAEDESGATVFQQEGLNGNLEAVFADDQYQPWQWLTLSGGIRLTHFSGNLSENAASPRVGASIQIPRLRWVLRAFYGRYYQAPPLSTVSGPGTIFDVSPDQGFIPLRGERDEQREFGVTIPVRGWIFDIDNFRTNARNFFDHEVLGNSDIFLPLTIASARIRGWEGTIHSPQIGGRMRFHLAYSYQFVQGRGGVTGGLTDFEPPEEGFFFLDHDQRHTLSTGFETSLPWHSWASADLLFGSGFLNGDGPAHLDPHTEVNFSIGKSFGDNWSVSATALNISNTRYLIDNSNTFGGTHFNYPRQISVQLKYRFHY
jgi:outer membrane receptor for ferrienterochelin and colicin